MKSAMLFVILFFVSFLSKSQTNTFTGESAGNGTSTGRDNSSYGYLSGDKIAGTYNSFFGSYAGAAFNNNGAHNVFIGYASGQTNATGLNNTFVGSQSGSVSTSGTGNTFIGCKSGFQAVGSNNLFAGYNAGQVNIGMGNVILGAQAGYSSNGSYNIFIGNNAGYNETGSNKLYIENSSSSTPLLYGDFQNDRLSINILPVTTNGNVHTLSVGGSIHATGIYVNGVSLSDGGFEFWTKTGDNVWNNTGNVGIGTPLTSNPNNYKLAVNGKLGAKEVQIENTSWPDYVFAPEYDLMPLYQLEQFINQNHHLPEIPSAAHVEKNGVLLGEMNAKLLQKIEELTLYIIDMKKQIDIQKNEISALKQQPDDK